MRRVATIPGFILSFIFILAGCGGGSSPKNTVTQVVLSTTSLSMNAGDVVQVAATPEDASKNPVTTSVSFSSSNTSVVTISNSNGAASALLCAGVWDSSFIVCNGTNSSGSAISGSANITATAQGVTSSALTVTVHPKVTSVVVDPVAGCTSSTHTQQFTAHACSSFVVPHASSGPCAPNAAEITSGIGSFTWNTTDATVATVDTNGLVTAATPGQAGIVATASGATSSATPYRTCMPVRIRLHVNGDPAGSPTTSANMTQNQNLILESDMEDENGVTTNSVATVIASNIPAVATMNGLTLTATSFGGGGIIAGCSPPACGNGFPSPFPIYSNLFRVTVAGASPATTVYATSSFAPPSGTSPTLVPIDTGTGNAGTAINLPGVPNSMVFASSGARAYLGTTAGLVALDPSANAVAVLNPSITGKVLAVSPNGSKVIVSNAAKDPQGNVIQPNPPNQRVWAFDQTNNSTQAFVKPGAVAANIDTDSFRDYIVTNDGTGNIYVFSPVLSLQTINIGGTSSDVTSLASDDFVYVANSAGLEVISTCNNTQQPTVNNPPTNSSTIQLVQPVANANVIVAVDSSGVDVETATVTPLTPPMVISPATCTPGISYSNQFLDFGIGAFTARQLLVASNGSTIAVLPVGNPNVLAAVPGATPSVAAIPLAGGGTQALSGGMTPDGTAVWVGVAGTNTVDKIDLTSNSDTKQVTTSFKKSDGSAAPPDIVAIRPK
ncbi:MAG TPA: Ig-like domain-containing protein [Candidatus Angelobacter sp.]|nr:Ig-like domain-containing protein [Candidatus Angelobacter sp.]